MSGAHIALKRSILLSARIRFSPETQPIRETAIDKIVEQNLLVAECDGGLTLGEIEKNGAVCFADGSPAIARLAMKQSLGRLMRLERVVGSGNRGRERYRLSEGVLRELWEVQQSAEARLSRVVGKLFRNAVGGPTPYASPFLECLCAIFSSLGETYVRLIRGELVADDLVGLPSLTRALDVVTRKHRTIDASLFRAAVISFFRDSDPDYDAIKWNMAQNYYVAKVLGLDPSGYLLSKEVFGDGVFYLDTNVIIHALEPKARHHGSFEVLSKACRRLQIQLKTCQISLEELRSVVEFHRELIVRVASQIPEDTAPKVRGIFFQLYREQLASKGMVDCDELFAYFVDPMDLLAQSYEVEFVDDPWFIEAEGQRETQRLQQEIRRKYEDRRGLPKRLRSALHDALLLRWIRLERERNGKNVWLVTLDKSLPGLGLDAGRGAGRPLAISLDAVLQWISPIAIYEGVEDDVARIFSEAVKYRLLPQESFFDLRDFLVFAEMELSCKELPSEDVEECIRYVKANAVNLDPGDPADREKIAREISKFFADPGRKYKREMQRLEAEMARIREEGELELAERENSIKERDERIARLEEEKTASDARSRAAILTRSARFRASMVISSVIIYEAGALYLTSEYGQGGTLLQKVIHSWPFLSLGGLVGSGLFWLVLDRERLRWPFRGLLGKQR